MYQSATGGNRPEADDIILLITDGVPTLSPENTIPEADKLKETGADVSNSIIAQVYIQQYFYDAYVKSMSLWLAILHLRAFFLSF